MELLDERAVEEPSDLCLMLRSVVGVGRSTDESWRDERQVPEWGPRYAGHCLFGS